MTNGPKRGEPTRYKVSEASEEEWEHARTIAARAPRCSDKAWRRLNAVLGYRLGDD